MFLLVRTICMVVAKVISENTNEKPLQYGFLMLVGLRVTWVVGNTEQQHDL